MKEQNMLTLLKELKTIVIELKKKGVTIECYGNDFAVGFVINVNGQCFDVEDNYLTSKSIEEVIKKELVLAKLTDEEKEALGL